MTTVGDAITATQTARAAGRCPPPLDVDACVELYVEAEPRPGTRPKRQLRMLEVLHLLFGHSPEELARALVSRGIRIRRNDRELLTTRAVNDLQRSQAKDEKRSEDQRRGAKDEEPRSKTTTQNQDQFPSHTKAS